MRNFLRWIIPIALTAGALYWIYDYERRPLPRLAAPEATHVVQAPNAEPAKPVPDTHFPIPQAPTGSGAENLNLAAALPPLVESDSALRGALVTLVGYNQFGNLFYPKDIVSHFVATIDNLPRSHVAPGVLPVKKVSGRFQIANNGTTTTIDPANFPRYKPYVDLLESVNPRDLVALYAHFYPLFQQAYRELGYPNGYFNDRLVAAIDDALAAPEPLAPAALAEPHLMYQFADPDIEALSAGQKTMIRIGPQNEAKVKQKLKLIRAELTAPSVPATPG